MKQFDTVEVNEALSKVSKMELRSAVNSVINRGKEYIYQCEDMTEDLSLCFDRYSNKKMLTMNELNNIYQLLSSISANFITRVVTPTCIESILGIEDAMSSGAFVGETIQNIEVYLKEGVQGRDVEEVVKPILATIGKVVADIENYNKQIINIIECIEDKTILAGIEEDFEVLKMLTEEISSLLDDIKGIRALLDLNFANFFNYVVTDGDESEGDDSLDIVDFERM